MWNYLAVGSVIVGVVWLAVINPWFLLVAVAVFVVVGWAISPKR